MGGDDFRFRLDCAQDAVTVRTLGQAVSIFNRMLVAADASDWRISDMELHSIVFAAKPVMLDERAERSFAALNVMTRLSMRDDVSRDAVSRFSGVLTSMNDLSKETGADIIISSRDVEGIFTPASLTGLNRLLVRSARRSFGHVRGKVDKIILQPTHRTVGLVDRVTQNRVDVKFGVGLDSVVQRIQMGMEVDIRGFARISDGELLSMEAEEITIMPTECHATVTAENLEGTIGLDFTGGLGSVDFVSALRDDDVEGTVTGVER